MRKISLEAERVFENRKASGENVRKKQLKFYWATMLKIDNHINLTKDSIVGRNILEIGCARGEDAMIYADSASKYTGVDISDVSIEIAQLKRIPNSTFVCTDGHELPFETASFDCVIVNSLLHHLDLKLAFSEISRVLKANGKLIYREPLGTNPIFQLYRLLTPQARTVDEKPFSFSDIKIMKSYFTINNADFYGFSNLTTAFIQSNSLRLILTKIDDLLAKTILRYFFWQFSGIATKIR